LRLPGVKLNPLARHVFREAPTKPPQPAQGSAAGSLQFVDN
jgi:hypothetical protein